MIDKSEPINRPNVWWILGADHLTFEGVMGDFRKISCKLISRVKKHANKFLKKNTEKISLMTYNAEKKTLYTVIRRGKNF